MARRSDCIGCIEATGTNFSSQATTVTDVATALPTTILDNRKAISIMNFSSTNWIYIGGSDVMVATGYPIQPYQGIPFDLAAGAVLYGICETGKTADVRSLEIDNG